MRRWMLLFAVMTINWIQPAVGPMAPGEKPKDPWNIAFKQQVIASGFDKGFEPSYAVDGFFDPWITPPQCWVRSGDAPNWIEVRFGRKAMLNGVELLVGRGARGVQLELAVRRANGRLTSLGVFGGKPDANGIVVIDLPKQVAGIEAARITMLDPTFPCVHELGLIGRIPGETPPDEAPMLACLASPDYIFHSGNVITMDPLRPSAEAVAVRGGRIQAVGSNAEVLPMEDCTEVIDLQGRTVMPGFVDGHTHALTSPLLGATIAERQGALLSNGITTVGELYVDDAWLSEFQALDATGGLRVRTNLYLVHNTNCGVPIGNWYLGHRGADVWGQMLRINGVKVFSDGGSCNLPAFSFEILPGNYGDLYLTSTEIAAIVSDAQAADFQVSIHAIGDRAIQHALDGLALALAGAPNTHRHRIEHNGVINPAQMPQYGTVGVLAGIASEFPSCEPFPPSPEPYREWEWPFVGLQAANPGLQMFWGGDFQGDESYSLNPFIHLYSFVTRHDVVEVTGEDCAAPAWIADDVFSVEQSLKFMTTESAYALLRETEVGSLEAGKLADMIIVTENPLKAPSASLKDIDVLMTMVGGRTEYCATGAHSLCP